jgi:hypothetical protein
MSEDAAAVTKKATRRAPLELKRAASARYRVLKGYESNKKNKYSSKALSKRRHKFFTTGKGAHGLLVRPTRFRRHLGRIRTEAAAEFAAIPGSTFEGLGKRKTMAKSFVQTISAANDALGNRTMALAYDFGKARHGGGDGVKLLNRDMELAIKWTSILSRRQ